MKKGTEVKRRKTIENSKGGKWREGKTKGYGKGPRNPSL